VGVARIQRTNYLLTQVFQLPLTPEKHHGKVMSRVSRLDGVGLDEGQWLSLFRM
jgi:hypothetical protein